MLRSRTSSRFAPLRSRRTLVSVAGSVVGGAGGAACWVRPIAVPSVVRLMSRVTLSSFGVVRCCSSTGEL